MIKKGNILLLSIVFGLACILIVYQSVRYNKGKSISETPTSERQFYIFSSTDQISDGVLKIEIIDTPNECIIIGQVFSVTYRITNTSEGPVYLIKNPELATSMNSIRGNFVPVFFSDQQSILYSPFDAIDVGFEKNPDDFETDELYPGDSFIGDLELLFPTEIIEGNDTSNEFSNPVPGKYYLKLLYRGYNNNFGAWDGKISSPLEQICIK